MTLADSFYIALCMTVLLIGVVYWFWTQTQYLQRKLNLLENIVYELKTLSGRGPSDSFDSGSASESHSALAAEPLATSPSAKEEAASYPPPPGSEVGEDDELLHEQLFAATEAPVQTDDLQPGGVGSGLPAVEPDSSLLDAQKPRGNVLDGMTLKELRRLAEQRSIQGASGMRKQNLIEALRSEVKHDVTVATAAAAAATAAADASPAKEKSSPISMSEETTLSLQ
jgi:hypothetical protein